MERLKLILACIWEAIIAYTAPMCIGLIYMDITGHSKGYAYDLGSEADISVAIGCVELIITDSSVQYFCISQDESIWEEVCLNYGRDYGSFVFCIYCVEWRMGYVS